MRTTASDYRFHHSHRLAAIGLVLSCLLCVSCANAFTKSPVSEKGSGAVAISLGSQSAKTIVAGSADYFGAINAYKVTVSGNGNTYTSTTVNPSHVCTITGIVAGSGYSVTVQAYSDSGATTQIAQGTTSGQTISEGATTPISVTLSFTQTANTGGFSLPIQWPVSTGLAYLHVTLDGTALADPTVTTGSTYYTTTLSASSLAGGVHTLDIYFRTSSSATTVIGPFIESLNIWDGVTDTMWADSNGALNATLTLAASEFSSSNAYLAGISVSGTSISSFAPTTYYYNSFPSTLTSGTSYPFVLTTASASQSVSCTFNGSAITLTAASATSLTGTFTAASGANTLMIIVTAADRSTTATYTVGTIIVSSVAGLKAVASQLSGTYLLAADIDATSVDWGSYLIGTYSGTGFSGTFDGNGYKVTYTIASNSNMGLVLFGAIAAGGVVKNLNVVCSIVSTASNWAYAGGIAGLNCGTITNCSSSGTITGSSTLIGGIAGQNGKENNGGTISDCYSVATLIGKSNVGGLVGAEGENDSGYSSVVYTISNSYFRGSVTGTSSAGGLVGDLRTYGTIANCYAAPTLISAPTWGGLVSSESGSTPTITASYYDSSVTPTGATHFSGDTGATATASMKLLSTFSAWSISATLGAATIWGIDTTGTINNGYPYLQYFGSNTVTP